MKRTMKQKDPFRCWRKSRHTELLHLNSPAVYLEGRQLRRAAISASPGRWGRRLQGDGTRKREVWKYKPTGRNRYGLRITLDNNVVVE